MTWFWLALALVAMPAARAGAGAPALPQDRPPVEAPVTVRLDRWGAAIVAVAALALLPWPAALAVAAMGAAGALRMLPQTTSGPAERELLSLTRATPDSIDLLAAVLRAGLPDAPALTLVAAAAPPVLRRRLAPVARLRTLGADPPRAWRALVDDPVLGDLALVMARHADSGAPVAALLDRVAADARRDYQTRAQAAARAAAVRAVIPLAVCFLPAFVLLGVVPLVASLVPALPF